MSEERQFSTGTVTLNYMDHGAPSAAPIVMLHGGAWCWQEYLSLIPSLGRRWHTYALDLRGNGRSGWVPNHYRLADFAEDNRLFIERLHAPTVLVGHSIGGVVALMVAARCPDNVKGLIIEDAPLMLENYRKMIDSSRGMFDLWLDLKNAAQSEQHLAFALANACQDCPGVTSAWILFFAGCLWRLDPTFFNILLNDFGLFSQDYDYQHIVSKIACPMLFLRGETRLGAVMTDDEISWLHGNCSNAQFASVDAVGHLLHLQEQGQTPVVTAMMAFLERIQTNAG